MSVLVTVVSDCFSSHLIVIATHPNTRACVYYCSTAHATPAASRTLLPLVPADTQGHAVSCTNINMQQTTCSAIIKFLLQQHYISLLVLSQLHHLDRSRSPTMVNILLVLLVGERERANLVVQLARFFSISTGADSKRNVNVILQCWMQCAY